MTKSAEIVRSRSGTDSSYDLIVECIEPRPTEGVIFEILGMESTPRLQNLQQGVNHLASELLNGSQLGLRCIIAQRVPEDFIWRARVRAAVAKALDASLNYPTEACKS